MTRRQFALAASGLSAAFGQSGRGEISLTSSSGVRLERFDDPQRPTVALYLPEWTKPSVVIEMPEHAWRKETIESEQSWFYKMYTDDPKLRGEVNWSKDNNALSFAMKTPSGIQLHTRATLDADGVAITHEVISDSEKNWAAVEAPTCVKLYRPFTDVFLERTYVHHPGGLELAASETPERLAKNAEEWLPCRYIVSCGENANAPAKRVERLAGVTRYFKSRAADTAFLATEAQSGGWVAATHSVNCSSVFTNPARTCHHADPRAGSITNGRAKLQLKMYLLKGTAQQAWDVVAARHRAGLA